MKIRIYSKRKTIAIVHSEEEAMRVIKEYKKQTNGGGRRRQIIAQYEIE